MATTSNVDTAGHPFKLLVGQTTLVFFRHNNRPPDKATNRSHEKWMIDFTGVKTSTRV